MLTFWAPYVFHVVVPVSIYIVGPSIVLPPVLVIVGLSISRCGLRQCFESWAPSVFCVVGPPVFCFLGSFRLSVFGFSGPPFACLVFCYSFAVFWAPPLLGFVGCASILYSWLCQYFVFWAPPVFFALDSASILFLGSPPLFCVCAPPVFECLESWPANMLTLGRVSTISIFRRRLRASDLM